MEKVSKSSRKEQTSEQRTKCTSLLTLFLVLVLPSLTSPALLQRVGEGRGARGQGGGEARAEDVGAVLRDGPPADGDEEHAADAEPCGAPAAGRAALGGALGEGEAGAVALGRIGPAG